MVTGESSPGCRSTATATTPGSDDSSPLTAALQWPHVMPATVISVWVLWVIGCLLGRMVGGRWFGRSAAHQACDGLGRLAHLRGCRFVGLAGRVDDAVRDVIFEQAEADRLQGLRDGADLGQDVDAVGVGVDHLLHAADLPLDAAQPLQVVVLAAGVSRHGTSSRTAYPYGVFLPVRTRRAAPSPVAWAPWPTMRRSRPRGSPRPSTGRGRARAGAPRCSRSSGAS